MTEASDHAQYLVRKYGSTTAKQEEDALLEYIAALESVVSAACIEVSRADIYGCKELRAAIAQVDDIL